MHSCCIKGQWYEHNGEYYQCDSNGIILDGKNIYWFRQAGYPVAIFPFDKHDIDKLKPASIEPDFSNAKEGDSCWSHLMDNCHIEIIGDDMIEVSNDDNNEMFLKDGKWEGNDIHPSLFNSFDQFMAYWAEQKLIRRNHE